MTDYAVLHWTNCLKCHGSIMEVEDVEPLCVACATNEAIINRTDDDDADGNSHGASAPDSSNDKETR